MRKLRAWVSSSGSRSPRRRHQVLAVGVPVLLVALALPVMLGAFAEGQTGSYGYGGYGGGPPTVFVSPTTDLVPGQTVTITAGNLSPGTSWGAVQCTSDMVGAPVSTSQAINNCTQGTTYVIGPSGTLVATVAVANPFTSFGNGQSHPCDAPGSCAVALGRSNGSSVSFFGSPISFAPPPDETDPDIVVTQPADGGEYVLNADVAADYTCTDAVELASCAGPVENGARFDTATVGGHTFEVTASDAAGNTRSTTVGYAVRYATGDCAGAAGHTILPPVAADGSSRFKHNETITLRFRVCDADGGSIGTPGVVTGDGAAVLVVDAGAPVNVAKAKKALRDPTPFAWEASSQSWVASLDLKDHDHGEAYTYTIPLDDDTSIQFSFSVK